MNPSENDQPLYVTTPFFPPIEEYVECLQQIWASRQLTNQGPYVCQLEQGLKEHLGVENVIAVSNGDAGLRIALRALEITGEVITTPFSYVSTTSSLLWTGLKPVFCDVEPDTLTIDPGKIEAAITRDTTAIMATHVFGNPCDVERLAEIAAEHDLKLIYDAAHAFGVEYRGNSVLKYGDISMVSLHATKIFHAAEGGILATKDSGLAALVEWRRRFGHNGTLEFHGPGINAKMSELNAAMGVCVLRHFEEIKQRRAVACRTYDSLLSEAGVDISKPVLRDGTEWNYSYYPVLFSSGSELSRAFENLEANNIFPRRYFYPSLNTVRQLGSFGSMPVSEDAASRVACLPLSHALPEDRIRQIVSIIAGSN
ncbi:MAG: DegT/DnrJ/EryC1/StrS family aminotransferase [Planctomycetota bacterium]